METYRYIGVDFFVKETIKEYKEDKFNVVLVGVIKAPESALRYLVVYSDRVLGRVVANGTVTRDAAERSFNTVVDFYRR